MKTCWLWRSAWRSCLGSVLLQTCFVLSVHGGSPLQLVSVPDPAFGPPAGGGGDSDLGLISRDGRYVLFASTADNLATVQTNRPLPSLFPAPLNVYLRDRTQGSTVLVSVNATGTGGADADSVPIGVSTNGRYALFESTADNLVAGDTNNASDVFMRDLVAGTTVLVSVATDGGFGDDASYSSAMTPDGRFVAFASAADNLVPGDTNGIPDVFLRDMVSHTSTLISSGAQNRPGYFYGVWSDSPVVTPDGRGVAFYSTASNVVAGVHTVADVYLRDVTAGITTWVGAEALPLLQSLGVAATNVASFSQALSDDGRFVAYQASPYPQLPGQPNIVVRYDVQAGRSELIATNAAAAFSSDFEDIQNLVMTPDARFLAYVANALDNSGSTTAIRVWDAQSGTNLLASANQTGSVTAGSLSDSPVLDDAGRFVAFVSSAPDLVTNPIPGDFHAYLRDLQTGSTTLIDADTNGAGSPIDPTSGVTMSSDGRWVAFASQDGGIVPLDRNHAYDVFVRDSGSSTSELVSVRNPGLPSLTPDGPSATSATSVSADARLIAFWSEADDLVGNDGNGLRDIFIRDRVAGTNLLVSINTNGVAADGLSTDPTISGDGQYVAFSSFADDLVPGDTNHAQDVFVFGLRQGTVQLVSMNAAGTGPGSADSYSPLLSSNGQFVLFRSRAGNLSPGMSAGLENLFWRDLQSQSTVALTTNGMTDAAMTPDGRWVAFITSSVKSSFSALSDRLYVWDSQSKSIVYSLNGTSFRFVAISTDGQRLAYATNNSSPFQLFAADRVAGTNFVLGTYGYTSQPLARFSANGRMLVYVAGLASVPTTNQVYLYDFQTGTNLLVSHSSDGTGLGGDNSDSPAVSPDGNRVVYRSAADNLVAGDTNGVPDIFLYDRLSGLTTLVTASRFGGASADNRSLSPFFSPDGSTLFFESWASDLVADDFNNSADLFALALPVAPAPFVLSVVPMGGAGPGNWLSWPVLAGKSYRVQFKNQLSDPVWQELNATISVAGDRAGLQDGVAKGTRFYRVLAY